MLFWLYILSIVGLAGAIGAVLLVGLRKKAFRAFTTAELATAALLICLLYAVMIPWQIGLAKIPVLSTLIFSIPYTTIFLIGLRLLPQAGIATLLIFGQGILGQLLGRGINPAWWPYYLWCAVSVEALLLVTGHSMRRLPAMIATGVLRGLIANCYTYLLLAPFLWQIFYAWWYIGMNLSLGVIGCLLGALLAWQLAPTIEKATRHSGL
ncbi:MAG: hypothetical protein PVH19_02390 [Planctomycetia bacterium]|jgi:hypothetical protein